MLRTQELTIEVAGRVVVDDASLSVYAGEKVGLVGRNGAGKTTLLRTIVGDRPPTSGSAQVTGALVFLPQDPLADRARAKDVAMTYVLSARGLDVQRERLETFRRDMEDDPTDRVIRRFSNAELAFREQMGIGQSRTSIGSSPDSDSRRTVRCVVLDVLSGGERRRVELVHILFGGTDNLVLDEPTNHLDVDAREWLMGFLRAFRGAPLVVSHDLQILDHAITKVLHLDDGDVRQYKGTYSQYVAARAKDEDRLRRIAAVSTPRSAGSPPSPTGCATRARACGTGEDPRQACGTARRRSGHADPRCPQRALPLPAAAAQRSRRPGDRRPHEGVRWPHDLVGACVRSAAGRRLLVLGLNGAGKTTLLRILAGLEPHDAGDVVFGTGVSVGYYAQEHEGVIAGTKVIDHLRHGTLTTETERRGVLGAFGLTGDVAFQDAGTLSGGEKTKLALA